MASPRSRHIPAFQLSAYPPAAVLQPMWEARAALEASAAAIVDVRSYSDKRIVFQLSLRMTDWPCFLEQMLGSGLGVEAPERGPVPELADQDGDVLGTFSVSLRGAGGEVRDLIPSVPG